jgi:hypothetical protein
MMVTGEKTKTPFRLLGNIDVSFFMNELNNMDWNFYVERQQKRYGMQDTQTLPIIWDINMRTVSIWSTYEVYKEEIRKIEDLFTNLLGPGTIYTCVLTNLPAGKRIDFHTDNGIFFQQTSRVHIPIKTNEQTFFQVGAQIVNMKVGEMWEILNSSMHHGTWNSGSTDRIHLMIDWMYDTRSI